MYIYIITHPLFDEWIKLGRAKDVNKRLDVYQTACPLRDFKLEYYVKTDHPDIIETHFKKTIRTNNHEWFKCSVKNAINEVNKQLVLIESEQYRQSFYKKKYVYKKKTNRMSFDYIVDGILFTSIIQLTNHLKCTRANIINEINSTDVNDCFIWKNKEVYKTEHIHNYLKA
jgi:hypothetical protein